MIQSFPYPQRLASSSRLLLQRGHVRLATRLITRPVVGRIRAQRWHTTSQGALALLKSRGYIKDIAGDSSTLDTILTEGTTGAYTGIDPTAPSLHLGHLIPLMLLFWLNAMGHNTTLLVGGGTARIGDPAGRLNARTAQTAATIVQNAESIRAQLHSLGDAAKRLSTRHRVRRESSAQCVVDDNYRYLGSLGIIEFLGVAGTVARLGTMLGRDMVRTRLEKDGMSFAEFSYPLLQAYDWWQLYRENGTQIQIGGSDQYGNIVAGQDLIKALADRDMIARRGTPIGLTTSLLTTASGAKFGKSAGNAIWLDAAGTSPFKLYGLLLGTSDADVERYLRLLTFVPNESIEEILRRHAEQPRLRKAQHLLAREVCDLVHGEDVAADTQHRHRQMRAPSLDSLTDDGSVRQAPAATVTRNELEMPMSKLLVRCGICKTNGEGSRMISSGGIYAAATDASDRSLRFEPIASAADHGSKYVLAGRDMLVVRKGKWDVRTIAVVDGPET